MMENLFSFSFSAIPVALGSIGRFIVENTLLCGVLFISYGLMYIYSFINNQSADSEVYEIDLLSSGLSTIMIAMLLIGIDESSKGFNLANFDISEPTTQIALFLLVYAFVMIALAFIKVLPQFLVVVFGNSELDFFINFTAILLTDTSVAVNGTMLVLIAVPLLTMLVVQRLRRAMG
ncbi:MAG: hypothetical protein Q8O89_03015 [Nanoarchaeota archaeon]|nr:hypothetical protein [Nanoarchaeota archaeon]